MWVFKPVRAPGFCRQAHVPALPASGLRDAPVPRAPSPRWRWGLPRRVGSRSIEPWCHRCRFSSAGTCRVGWSIAPDAPRLRYPAQAKPPRDQMLLLGLRSISPSRSRGSRLRAAPRVAAEGMSRTPSPELRARGCGASTCLLLGQAHGWLRGRAGTCSPRLSSRAETAAAWGRGWWIRGQRWGELPPAGWGQWHEEDPSASAQPPPGRTASAAAPLPWRVVPGNSLPGEASPAIWLPWEKQPGSATVTKLP